MNPLAAIPNEQLTQKELKKVLYYNADTGVFIRIKRTSNSVKIGDASGYLDKSNGYIKINVMGKQYFSHRLACLYMKGRWPKCQMDHIDHVRDNNRWLNLRESSNQENCKNRTLQSNNTSGVCGVTWFERDKKWKAQIKCGIKNINLGHFTDKFEAICSRKSANNKYKYHSNHGGLK